MLTQWLFAALLTAIDWFASFLPTSPALGLNDKAAAAVGTGVFARLGWANAYLPLSDVADGIAVVLSVFVVLWLVRLVLWVLNKVHVLGGDDGA